MVKNITKEQQEYRADILRKMRRKKKDKPVIIPEPTTRETYMKSCMYWITEYIEGRTTKERLKTASFYLKQYCDEILNEKS